MASSDTVRDATGSLVDTLTDALTRTRQKSGCRVRPLGYHRGGDPIHDACADTAPPNVFPGSDIEVTVPGVGKKSFDALSSRRELWEVKTERYSSYAPFIYVFAVSDSAQLTALGARVPLGVNLRLVSC